jgi:hypothetical protein
LEAKWSHLAPARAAGRPSHPRGGDSWG